MLELERVWLVRDMPTDLSPYDFAKIDQHYLDLENGGRLRKRRDYRVKEDGRHVLAATTFELTQKKQVVKGDKKRRDENNIILSEELYELVMTTVVRGLKKTRYLVTIEDGLTAELDVFENDLKGLIWVEVEFPSEEKMEKFQPPTWFGREITDEKWASSSWVAGRTYEKIRPLLTE